MQIRKGDTVKIIGGKDNGKTGKVIKVLPQDKKIVIENLNLRVKNAKPRKQGEKGQRIQFPAPLNISNAALICPKCGRPTRVGHKILEDKKKVRICKKCKEVI